MPRARSPNRDKAFEIFKDYGGSIENRRVAEMLGVSEKTVGGWKCKDRWNEKLNGVLQTNKRSTPKNKKVGAPIGNKNATGPPENKNAEKHGLFARYLPAETLDIINNMPKDPLDILWDQIQLAYAAVVRAQQIMHVKNQEDSTKVTSMQSLEAEAYLIQMAWDKQANFMKAQARAQGELRSLVRQYEEMLKSGLATEEQKNRIEKIKAETAKIVAENKERSGEDQSRDDGFLDALNGNTTEDWEDEETTSDL